jgi:predicted RNA polymerase sigma factor
MASGPAAGLELVDVLESGGALNGSHLVATVRGELLTRLGRYAEAKGALLDALGRCSNAAERTALERKIAQLSDY